MAIISSAHAAETRAGDPRGRGRAGGEAHHEGAFRPSRPRISRRSSSGSSLIFGLLYVLMSRIALPRVGGIIENRESQDRRDLDASREMQAKAQAAAAAQ